MENKKEDTQTSSPALMEEIAMVTVEPPDALKCDAAFGKQL